jgi:DNA modification methylase
VNIIPKKILGDCRAGMRSLPADYFHLCVSSPPYWGLREYLPKDHPLKHLEIGNEPTVELYLEHIVEVFAEVARVLRPDGLLWVNIGDKYSSGGRRSYDRNARSKTGCVDNHPAAGVMRPNDPQGIKKKDLLMLPSRVAMALQSAGWYLRAQVPWIKRNAMPESADDRPAVAVEYFFMFSKSQDYFYDSEAVKISASQNTHPRSSAAAMFPTRESRDADRRRVTPKAGENASGSRQNADFEKHLVNVVGTRNRRNSDWWIESFQGLLLDDDGDPLSLLVNPKGTTIKHFASYPPKLIEPIVKCSTSDGGCCQLCGVNYERIIKDDGPDLEHQKACGGDMLGEYDGTATKDFDGAGVQNASDVKRRILAGMRKKTTVGFKQGCDCNRSHPVPCRVLDPFHGTGCTSQVAVGLGREYTGFEISDVYFKDSDARDSQTGLHLV